MIGIDINKCYVCGFSFNSGGACGCTKIPTTTYVHAPPMGWVCPVCHAGVSPFSMACPYCAPKMTVNCGTKP